MYRVAFAAFFLLLSGCCSLGSPDERSRACQRSLDKDHKAAALKGWKNAKQGFSDDAEPALHEGMKAGEVKRKLGTPSRKEKSQDQTQWIYAERSLKVFMEDGKVVRWEKQEKENT